ncbi:NUDIX domain-containing protein [Yanghanlia caeni]|uniref:NUDIX hydrolase n=1 Tax=Yanghanlia caeni TaxID=3064283 RepID=A0ABU1D9M7_9BURK|nr:NUDIX hydrolase [Alcaligenaceae bacterium LG-2]NGR09202.1 NUDIX hydrolase [bacterium SGD-2]HZH57786.1 NUDIX hydrolase [Burkholderiaceae bacterium]
MTSQAPTFYFPAPRAQKYCSLCGTQLSRRVPPEDNRVRDVCDQCGAIHYQNPRNVVGVVPVYGDRILLCRRAIEPRLGKWTLPAGFMELGETTAQGAMRETQEEAGAQIELGQLYTIIDVPQAEQVHFFYLAKVVSPALYPGPESSEAAFFRVEDIPWNELSFRTVSSTLRHYVEDARTGVFPVHHYDIPDAESN